MHPDRHPPNLLADYGDGVLHRFGWYAPPHILLQVAACRSFDDVRPSSLCLDYQAPDGATLCPYCQDGEKAPRINLANRGTRPPGTIPNEPLRRAFEESGVSLQELARRLGERRRPGGKVDSTRLARVLGLRPGSKRLNDWTLATQGHMTEENAVRIAKALHLDPIDIGL